MMFGFVGSASLPSSIVARRRSTCSRWRMMSEDSVEEAEEGNKRAPVRIRQEIFDGFKQEKLSAFPKRGSGSKFDFDMQPPTADTVCADCSGSGKRICSQCNGREYLDPTTKKFIICDGCGGKSDLVCSTCVGTGKRPQLKGRKWWQTLPSFFK